MALGSELLRGILCRCPEGGPDLRPHLGRSGNEEEDGILIIIDLREFTEGSLSRIKTLKGRIIGKEGQIWKKIEELTNVKIAMHKYNVGIMGEGTACEVARKAISMIIKGARFNTVFKYLEQQRRLSEKRIWLPKDSTSGRNEIQG